MARKRANEGVQSGGRVSQKGAGRGGPVQGREPGGRQYNGLSPRHTLLPRSDAPTHGPAPGSAGGRRRRQRRGAG